METSAIIGLISLFTGLTVFFVWYAVASPIRAAKASSLDDDILGNSEVTYDEGDSLGKYVRPVLDNFLPRMPEINLSAERKKSLNNLLIKSGNPWHLTADEFLGISLALSLLGLLLGGALAALGLFPASFSWALPLVFGGAGAVPYSQYNSKKQARSKAIERELPEALDLLVITIKSGQTFEYALENITTQLPEGLLKSEFIRVVIELQAGSGLEPTLMSMAKRYESEDLESFAKAVVQTQKLGADVSETLSQQADFVRANYEARLERMIARLGTTVFIPLSITMLPAFLVIFVAPMIMQILQFL